MNKSSCAGSYSLERHVRRKLLLTIMPAFVALVLILHLGMSNLIEGYIASRLQNDTENFISALQVDGANWTLPDEAVALVYKRVRSGRYYIIQWPDGEFRSRSLWDLDVNPVPLSQNNQQYFINDVVVGENWLVSQQSVTKKETPFTFWLAEDVSSVQATLQRYEFYLIGTLFFSILLLLIWQRQILRGGFARLNPLRDALLSGRFEREKVLPENTPLEVSPLIDSIFQLIDRSVEQTRRSRLALGNLAHELKLPLQRLQDIAQQCQSDDLKQQLDELFQQLQRRIDSELRRARISGNPMPGSRFYPQEEIPYLIKLLNRMRKGHQGVDIKYDVPDQVLPLDRDDMLELLGNLLDNAWRYAKSRVNLRISEAGNGWELIVEDDGKGVNDDALELLTCRGVRLDEQHGEGGYGLGLSICQSIAESYGGSITFSRSPLGGLKVRVSI